MSNDQEERAQQARKEREEFSIRLMSVMIKARVNVPELARRLKKSPRTVNGWVKAEHLPNLDAISDIGQALNCDGVWLRLGACSAIAGEKLARRNLDENLR